MRAGGGRCEKYFPGSGPGLRVHAVVAHTDQAMVDWEVVMKKILLFLALGFALFAAPAVVMYPQAAVADGSGCTGSVGDRANLILSI